MADDQNQDQKEEKEEESEEEVEEVKTEDNPPAAGEEAKEKEPEKPKEEAKEKEEKAEEKSAPAVKEPKPAPSKPLSAKLEKIIKEIERLSVLELSDLVKALEDRFGVTAAAPVAVATPAGQAIPSGTPSEEPSEEQTTFNVILAHSGANKIAVIKALREINPQLGLKETKDIVDAPPKEILTGVNKETAGEAKQKLKAAGATVELK